MANIQISLLILLVQYIVSGQSYRSSFASIRDFPYAASLGIFCTTTYEDHEGPPYLCGSSILHKSLVLTAGHCLHTCLPDSAIVVSAGHAERLSGVITSASAFVIHKDLNWAAFINDIALVKLRTAFQFGANINRVGFWDNPHYNKKAVVAGWGESGEGYLNKHLRYMYQYVINKTMCTNRWTENWTLHNQLCVTNLNKLQKRAHPESAESGSALVIHKNVQIGIASHLNFYYAFEKRAFYTEVSKYITWIQEHSRVLFQQKI